MGSLAYKVEGIEAAKTLLFNSCQLSPPLVRGLFALAVIGVQHTDMNLLEAALHEMKPHVTDPRYSADIAFLTAAVLVLKGDEIKNHEFFSGIAFNCDLRKKEALVRFAEDTSNF